MHRARHQNRYPVAEVWVPLIKKERDGMKEEGIPRRDFLKGMTVLCGSGVARISRFELSTDAAEVGYAKASCIRKERWRFLLTPVITVSFARLFLAIRLAPRLSCQLLSLLKVFPQHVCRLCCQSIVSFSHEVRAKKRQQWALRITLFIVSLPRKPLNPSPPSLLSS